MHARACARAHKGDQQRSVPWPKCLRSRCCPDSVRYCVLYDLHFGLLNISGPQIRFKSQSYINWNSICCCSCYCLCVSCVCASVCVLYAKHWEHTTRLAATTSIQRIKCNKYSPKTRPQTSGGGARKPQPLASPRSTPIPYLPSGKMHAELPFCPSSCSPPLNARKCAGIHGINCRHCPAGSAGRRPQPHRRWPRRHPVRARVRKSFVICWFGTVGMRCA